MSNKTTAKQIKTTANDLLSTPIFLVGMMGVGKTTIGRQLALSLDRQFVDLDHAIEERSGVPIVTIFDIEGEPGFRKRETSALDEFTQQADLVLATGGGAVLSPANRHMLRDRGLVVYLRADLDILFKRLARDSKRPLLQTKNPKQRIQDLIQQREPLYASVANVTFDTGGKQINAVVNELIEMLNDSAQTETRQIYANYRSTNTRR